MFTNAGCLQLSEILIQQIFKPFIGVFLIKCKTLRLIFQALQVHTYIIYVFDHLQNDKKKDGLDR